MKSFSLYFEAKVKFLLTVSPLGVEAVTTSNCFLCLFNFEYVTFPSSITAQSVETYYSLSTMTLLHVRCLLFRLHEYPVTGLFALNVKVKLLPSTDGLHIG